MTVADVYKDGVLAATLDADGVDTTFAYVDHYSGPSVAHSLPLASIHRWVGWVERAVTNECPCYWDIGTCLESKITK